MVLINLFGTKVIEKWLSFWNSLEKSVSCCYFCVVFWVKRNGNKIISVPTETWECSKCKNVIDCVEQCHWILFYFFLTLKHGYATVFFTLKRWGSLKGLDLIMCVCRRCVVVDEIWQLTKHNVAGDSNRKFITQSLCLRWS